jgi:hypothetical protein
MTATPAYRDPTLPIEARLADLLPRLTLAEKCAQLAGPFVAEDDDGRSSPPPARAALGGGTAVFDFGLVMADWGMGNGRSAPPPVRAELGGETAVWRS